MVHLCFSSLHRSIRRGAPDSSSVSLLCGKRQRIYPLWPAAPLSKTQGKYNSVERSTYCVKKS